MTGIRFESEEKGRGVAVQIDRRRYGAVEEDFGDGLTSESRGTEEGIPLEEIKAHLAKHGRLRE